MSAAAVPARPSNWLIGLVLALAAMRFAAAGLVGLTEDEAYYRLWALNPSWGYYDHPPMVAWWIWAGMATFGDNALGIRAPAIVAGLLGALVLWRTAFVLTASAPIADRAVLFLQATLLIGLGGMMITPDAPVVLFWGLSLWTLAEWRKSGGGRWFLAMGLFAGLGLLSKYSMLFFGAGTILWLAADRRNWAAFASPWLWIGGVLALVLALPMVLWNAEHDWVSFAKQFGRAAADRFTFRYLGEMIGGIFGLLNPLIGLLTLRAFWPAVRRTVPGVAGLVVLTSAPFLVYLSYHVFHDRVQANWPAPLYPGFVLLAAAAADQVAGGVWRWIARAAAPVGIALSVLLSVHAVHPLSTAAGRKDPILRTTSGWQAVGDAVARHARENNAEFVATTSYVLTGELAFHLPRDIGVTPLVEPERYLNGAVTPLAWIDFEAPTPGLYVVLARRDGHELDVWFAEHEKIAEIPRLAGEHELERYHVYRVVR